MAIKITPYFTITLAYLTITRAINQSRKSYLRAMVIGSDHRLIHIDGVLVILS